MGSKWTIPHVYQPALLASTKMNTAIVTSATLVAESALGLLISNVLDATTESKMRMMVTNTRGDATSTTAPPPPSTVIPNRSAESATATADPVRPQPHAQNVTSVQSIGIGHV